MTTVKNLNMRIALVLSLIVMIAIGTQTASAETMPDLRDGDGTLRVEVRYTDEDKVTDISGAELTIYKVADLSVNNGAAKYTLTGDFSGADVDVAGMTAAESIKAAGIFYGIVTGKNLQGKTVTSQNGIADFGAVSHGMYLVVQTGAVNDASGYDRIEPYLVQAPQPMTDIGENAWNYDVLSIPKMVLGDYEPPEEKEKEDVRGDYESDKDKKKEDTGKKTKKADTGDDTGLYVWVSLIPIALAAMILTGMLRRRRGQDN